MVVGETHSLVAARKNMLSFSLAKHHICSRPQFWCSLCDSRSRSHSLALSLYLSQSPSNKDCIFVAKKHCVVDSIPILAEWIQMCAWQIVYCWVVFVGICWWNSCFSCQTSVHPSCFWQITTTVGKHHIFLARHQFILQCFWMFLDVSGKSPYFHICSG